MNRAGRVFACAIVGLSVVALDVPAMSDDRADSYPPNPNDCAQTSNGARTRSIFRPEERLIVQGPKTCLDGKEPFDVFLDGPPALISDIASGGGGYEARTRIPVSTPPGTHQVIVEGDTEHYEQTIEVRPVPDCAFVSGTKRGRRKTVFKQGQGFKVKGPEGCLDPNETYDVFLDASPPLASRSAREGGSYVAKAKIPLSTPPGVHTIYVEGDSEHYEQDVEVRPR